jgi:hypothetical protein
MAGGMACGRPPGAFPEDRPYRRGWSVLPEEEGSVEDEIFTDLEAIRETLDSGAARFERAPGQVALRHDALYAAVEEEMRHLRSLLSGEPSGGGEASPSEETSRREGSREGIYLCLDTDGLDHADPLANVFVYRPSYPTVHYDAPSGGEVEIRNDAEMDAWLARNWDHWRRDPTF